MSERERPLAPELPERGRSATVAVPGGGVSAEALRILGYGLGPLALLAVLVFALLRVGPLGIFETGIPPLEELTVERITLPAPNLMRVHVVNGGPEPVTVAQVLVDEAVWVHEIDGPRQIERLGERTLTLRYPWVRGEPHAVTLVTSTGATFGGEVAVSTQTPSLDGRFLGTFAVLGIYVGVVPVLLGLLWLPFLRRIRPHWLDFFLAFTVGLLVFLGVDAVVEALDNAAAVAGAYQGVGLVLLGFVGAALMLSAAGRLPSATSGAATASYLATLIALGIGLHNLGEGLAIGSAYATGEVALGTFLVLGFLIHNTTEGLAIVAPLASVRTLLRRLVGLGLLAGLPTILGAWIGGASRSPALATLFFAVGAGAIAQVVWEIGKALARSGQGGLGRPLPAAGLLLGMVVMYVTGLFVAA